MEEPTAALEMCSFCQKLPFKYTCPKCNLIYCSVGCYKSAAHLKCSEEFYKSCIQEELTSNSAAPNSSDDIRKMYDILKRMQETDAGLQPEDFDQDQLDSDDDDNAPLPESEEFGAEEDVEAEDDIAVRLQDIDINNADKVWECLNATEKQEFQRMVESGDIMKLLPNYKPWWVGHKRQTSKIVELPTKEGSDDTSIPKIASNIPQFSSMCKKEPSPCLHYNLWNILAAYACTLRYFAGEHQTNASEAVAQLVNLSATLKYGTNFEDADDAIISVEMEALTTGNGATVPTVVVESREQLQADARDLMFTQRFKLAALSDILQLVQLARRQLAKSGTNEAEFHKLFAMCNGSAELNSKKLQQLDKKVQFFISFLQRDSTDSLI